MLYAFGSNGSGQLSLDHTDDPRTPQHSQATSASSIKQIAAGGNHTLILHEDGSVETFGTDDHGQCNLQCPFTQPSGGELAHVTQVAATWNASTFLYSDGRIATSGQGLSGELGQGKGLMEVSQPRIVPNFPPSDTTVVQLASCMAHTVAVLSNGEVWGWGKGRKGQLGEPAEDVWSPRKIEGILFPAAKAVCGRDFTCIIGDRLEGRLRIFGLRKSDRFGLVASLPAAVPGWEDIAASWCSVFVLLKDGSLLGFGRNDHGQLPPPDMPSIEAIAAGSEHCLALTKAGIVLAWGWGEHGNCGEPTDENGDVKARWNQVDVPGTVDAVFAGCATSFVVAAGAKQRREQG